MDAERWRRVEALFHEALEREGPERSRFLDEQCGVDPEVRRELDRWLAADDHAPSPVAAAVGDALRAFSTTFAPGTRIGPYEIVGLIGEGGMGSVYRARRNDGVFQKDVAIKVVKRGMDSGALLDRFRRERQILARLEHPNIARVLDGGSNGDGLPYLVMEYVEGQTLLEYARTRALDLPARLLLFARVCEAVAHAHQHGIVHRDLKPTNILVDEDGRPRLLDFGVAKLTRPAAEGRAPELTGTGGAGLTPRYASPEQVKGEPITASSDVYSLGVILYELLTGRAVHRAAGDSPAAIVKAICVDEVTPPSAVAAASANNGVIDSPIVPDLLQGDLDRIVLKALEKEPGRRYASVDALADELHQLIARLTSPARSGANRRWSVRRRRVAATVAVALGLAVGIGAGVYQLAGRGRTRVPAGRVMLAALPLENLTGNKEQEIFIDGLHEEIIARLGRLQPDRLGVIARTSTLQYRDTTKSIATIGGELGAHYILEGSVRQAGERVRVSAQLILVSDQTQLWTETFERDIRDLLSVQLAIGAEVADSLAVDVLPQALATVGGDAQVTPEVYATYLRGKHFWHRRWLEYPANLQRARDHFQAVVASAPGYAEGHAALGQTYNHLSMYAGASEKRGLQRKAREALSKALALDPHLASAIATLALIRFQDDWDWPAAERGYREALKENANVAETHQWLASMLAYTGRHEEAEHESRMAVELDPLSPPPHTAAFFVQAAAGRLDKAETTVRRLAELFPGSSSHIYFASLLLALRGDCPRARAQLARLEPLPVNSGVLYEDGITGYVLGRCGTAGEGARHVDSMEAQPHHYAYTIAHACAGLGDRPRALRWIEESHRRREAQMVYIAVDPILAALHDEPRFRAVLQAMRLTAAIR